jgi:hypothetical protein
VERERSRESDFLRRQNEAAEKLKGLTAKEQQAEQLRTHYEQALPTLLQALQQQQAGEFADITSIADIERLARDDWPRYVLWDAQQKRIAAVAQEMQASRQRRESENSARWGTFAHEQDSHFLEKARRMRPKCSPATRSTSRSAPAPRARWRGRRRRCRCSRRRKRTITHVRQSHPILTKPEAPGC